MGVNPYRDAFVMGPVSADPGPDKTLSFEDLVKLSAAGFRHAPSRISGGRAVNGASFPSVAKDDSGNWNVQIKGHGKAVTCRWRSPWWAIGRGKGILHFRFWILDWARNTVSSAAEPQPKRDFTTEAQSS